MHDPLCTQRYQPYEDDSNCHDCTIIEAAYKRGYEDALEDMKDN